MFLIIKRPLNGTAAMVITGRGQILTSLAKPEITGLISGSVPGLPGKVIDRFRERCTSEEIHFLNPKRLSDCRIFNEREKRNRP